MYADGDGVPQDYIEAAKWYRKTADRGYPAAQHLLDAMYARGDGAQQDYTMSFAWFKIAATSGDQDTGDARATALKIITPQQVAEGQR